MVDEKIELASLDYGPIAIALVVLVTIEFFLLAILLAAKGNLWAWGAFGLGLFCLWALKIGRVRLKVLRAKYPAA